LTVDFDLGIVISYPLRAFDPDWSGFFLFDSVGGFVKRLKWLTPVIAGAAAITIGLTVAPAANASSLGTYNGSGIRIRSEADTTGGSTYGLGYFGQQACTYFAVTGQNISGDPYWDYNKDLSTGAGPGYSADYYMYPFYYGQSC
jgi:hypothetical protein